ncbi:hypothetical protein [Allochromatium palmeri]|uniref:Uncharacterized protein n=1 Tax=Allochromatium palmeri TaxID=231048 RepID=A0A6N8EFN4_9GAMM|nr:hypothetical protein [Allochromatium palmeri]MTW23033.1 hypothetical protein [Allochromatium palmeri]
MPLQNRVDPWGNLMAVEALGAWMGNRGILHDSQATDHRALEAQGLGYMPTEVSRQTS